MFGCVGFSCSGWLWWGLGVRRKKQFQEQSKKEKKAIAETIKKAEESVEAMNVARKSMLKYNSSFAEGLQT